MTFAEDAKASPSPAFPSLKSEIHKEHASPPFQTPQYEDAALHVAKKIVEKGLAGISLEELYITMIVPDFGTRYKETTGEEWSIAL